jgi:HSP20 family molecular chaperone IbpA
MHEEMKAMANETIRVAVSGYGVIGKRVADAVKLQPDMAVNVYRSENYVVVDAGLPRCRPENIQVTLAPDELLIEAERHPGETAVDDEREYLVRELPYGTLSRVIQLPRVELALHSAEAHFENGLLTVTIARRKRDAYVHGFRGEDVPEDV